MKIIHCPNTPDGYDYDVWQGVVLVKRFKTRRAAENFIARHESIVEQKVGSACIIGR